MESLSTLRTQLAAALRAAAHYGLNEGVCNHFSVEYIKDRYLINPQGLHWSEVTASDILLIDGEGKVIDGKHSLEPTAFFIHSWIHRLNPLAKVVLHTHMPYATALTLVNDGKLAWCNQNALRFFGRVAYDSKYHGLALDASEGERIASQLRGRDVLFMASHGVTVVGQTIPHAFDDLYYLERACMHQCLAQQMAGATGKLREIPTTVAERVARQIAGERQQSDLFFASLMRMLDKQDAHWRE